MLEALQAAIAGQPAPLDDPSLTGTEVLGGRAWGSATVLAQKLTGHLVRESWSAVPAADPGAAGRQLNHDATHLQGQRIEDNVGRLDDEVRKR